MKNLLKACALGFCLLGGVAAASENDWFKPLGPPPKAAPKRMNGGEGMPPLPLPATPLRRSERKRQPSPPSLVGKVQWGESASFTYDTGDKADFADWNLCPADLQTLLEKSRNLGVTYGSEPVNLATFHGDPGKTPILLISGVRTVRFSPEQIELLRAYVQRGGMVVFDSVAGSPYFNDSARALIKKAFPEEPLRLVPTDHPVFHIACDSSKVHCPKNRKDDTPLFEAIYIGCRIGMMVSSVGMGTGWDNHEVPLLDQAVYYDVDSANRLGVNLIAYAIGYAPVGQEEARPELFGERDEKHPTDEFVFAQLTHGGAWNVHPGAASALLQRITSQTAVRASLKRVPVTAGKDDLGAYPFLYLAGLDDFSLDEAAAKALRGFLTGNGTLLINNGLGLATFDAAVRRELAKVLPDAKLMPVPADHPIYKAVYPVTTVQYSPAMLQAHPGLDKPDLEGISVNGDLRVIYSPCDLEAGWQGGEHPGAKTYDTHSSCQLGVNVVMYAVTH